MSAQPEPTGTRIRAVRWSVSPGGFDDNRTVPPGTEGTVTGLWPKSSHPDDYDKLEVDWDNGSKLPLLVGLDEYEVIEDG